MDEYKVGCKYTTPERFNFHMGLETGNALGAESAKSLMILTLPCQKKRLASSTAWTIAARQRSLAIPRACCQRMRRLRSRR